MKVLESVEKFTKIYDKLLTDVAKKYGITLIQLKILMFLDQNECDVAKDVVIGLKATKSHVSMAVCDLEQKKLVEKVPDEKDKKQSHLDITKESIQIIQEGYKVNERLKTIMIEGLSKEELEHLDRVVKKMKENLEKYNLN